MHAMCCSESLLGEASFLFSLLIWRGTETCTRGIMAPVYVFCPPYLTFALYQRHSNHRRAHTSDRAQKLGGSVCNECGLKPEGRKRLNRCVGCNIVEYCSVKCQKKAWGGHKEACRLAASSNAILIRPSPRPDGMFLSNP